MLRILAFGLLLLNFFQADSLRADAVQPQVESAVFNASSWDYEQTRVLKLSGQWMFHWKRLYSADEILSEVFLKEKSYLIQAPSGSWEKLNPEFEARGWVSYVLQIKGLKAPAGAVSVVIGQFANSHKTWLYIPSRQHVQLLAEVGVVTTSENTAIPMSRKAIAPLPELDGSDVYLIMGASTFFNKGSFSTVPELMNTAWAVKNDQYTLLESCFVLGMFFLLVISNTSLFVLRPEDKPSLLIAVFSLVMGLRYCSTEVLLSRFFTEPSNLLYQLIVSPNIVTFPLGLAIYFQFFKISFPGFFPRRAVFLSWALGLGFMALVIIAPKWASPAYVYFMMPFLPLCIWMFAQLIGATLKGVRGALLAFIGIALLIASMANDTMVFLDLLPTPYLGHYGMVVFIFCQSLIVGSNFSFAFRTAETLSKNLQIEVARQTRDVKAILRNIHQGIFTVNTPALLVGDDYSDYLETILETKSIKDRSALELIFANSNLDDEQKSIAKSILEGSIDEISLNFDLNQDNLIREIQLKTSGGKEKILLVDWQPVINEKTDIVEKLLVTLRDVTELKSMEIQNRKQQRDIELIGEIIEISPDKFDLFMKSGQKFIDENRRLIQDSQVADANILKILFINMHTIKGAARTYRFKSMTSQVHDSEQYYASVQKGECLWSQSDALVHLELVQKVFEEYRTVNQQKLKRGENLDVIKIDLETVRENIKNLHEIENFNLDERMTPFVDHVRKTFYSLYFMDLDKLFEDICKSLPSLAKDLQKPVPKVSFQAIPAGVSSEGCEVLRNIFVHILRNTMDHGIEDAETRLNFGKTETGNIHFDISIGPSGTLQIIYGDDGVGLKLDQIHQTGVSRGLVSAAESSHQKIAELIFLAGFSTAKSVSDISGRGVGMGAVREYLEQVGGEVFIRLKHQYGSLQKTQFEFDIRLPSKFFTVYKAEKTVVG